MRILVTGGAGFIGSNLVHRLLDTRPDVRVTVLDALTYAGNRPNLQRWEGSPRFRFLHGDVTDPAAVEAAMDGCDACLHLAAESHVDRSILDGGRFLATNVTGTHVLLEAARKHGLQRFVHVSTDEVYGSIEEGSFRETDPLAPSSPYSASKASSDLVALAHQHTYGTPVVVTRATNNIGPYQYPEKLIPFFIARALEDEPLPVYGDGMQVRDWIYVDDHCDALLAALDRGEVGEAYNVGAGNEWPNLRLTHAILDLLGKPRTLVRHVEDRPGHDRRYSVDTRKMAGLGWAPAHAMEEALERTVSWYLQNRTWWEALRDRSRDFMKRQYEHRIGGRETA